MPVFAYLFSFITLIINAITLKTIEATKYGITKKTINNPSTSEVSLNGKTLTLKNIRLMNSINITTKKETILTATLTRTVSFALYKTRNTKLVSEKSVNIIEKTKLYSTGSIK